MYLTVKQVAARYGVDVSTIWRWRKDSNNNFPQPVKLSEQVVRWKLADLDAWDAALEAEARS